MICSKLLRLAVDETMDRNSSANSSSARVYKLAQDKTLICWKR